MAANPTREQNHGRRSDGEVIFEKCACDECRHYQAKASVWPFRGIPLAIQSGDIEHCMPFAGDKGIIFEEME